MSSLQDHHHQNQLLLRMPREDFALLQPHMRVVQHELRDELIDPDTPLAHVYFLESAVSSVIAMTENRGDIEAGMVGREGMIGTVLVLGAGHSPHKVIVQVPGSGISVPADAFADALASSPTLRPFLLLYVQTTLVQVASTALANGRFKLEERLARWLLMIGDRFQGDRFTTTHEFLAIMLGVRRAGVTVALHALEGMGLIRSNRAELTILDREGLMELAQESYGTAEKEYQRLMA